MAEAASMSKEALVDFVVLSNLLPVHLISPEDVANAAIWLASEEGRYITGQTMNIDAGRMLK
jgi:NAD(P)-dependent dehydrogenase (short-subunit alcohol dehydrogenase family)